MFKILFKPLAIAQLKKMKRYYARIVVDAIESHLSEEPERIHGAIKRLRGKQEAIFGCGYRIIEFSTTSWKIE